MRCLFTTVWRAAVIGLFVLAAPACQAATIEGRVVDSSGNQVAGAEVRIWQRFAGPIGRPVDRPVEFDGGNVLKTDAEGRFASPDVLDRNANWTMIVAEAEGLLVGRSGWLRVAKDEAVARAPEIRLKRLRIITGKVLDRRGQPVDGATVFNTGDGHERVETTSKGGGKFRLANVPDGGVFLFAEKQGYRLTGLRLPAEKTEAVLTLTSVDEAAEPLTTLPPLFTPDEEYALARQVLDPWLERSAKAGTQLERIGGFTSLIEIDPLEAFQRLDRFADLDHLDQKNREILRSATIRSVIARHARVPRDELRSMIDSGVDEFRKAAQLVEATDEMGDGERALRLEWLDAVLQHARKVDDPTQKIRLFATVSERLFRLGEAARAKQLLSEAEHIAKPLFADAAMTVASLRLALAAAHEDAGRALGWLDRAGIYVGWHGGRVAAKFLPDRPQQAVEVWKRVAPANRAERLAEANRRGRPSPIQYSEYRAAADFCYHLALADRALAEQVAAEAENEALRFWQQGAVILALAETQPAEARRRLTGLVREDLPQLKPLPAEKNWPLPLGSAPAIAAWLLPVAEKVAPDVCRELFWRSLALRLPRPRRDDLDGQFESADFQLAKLLARYDRDIARALLEPAAVEAIASDPERVVMARLTSMFGVFLAAVHTDPHWAKSLLDAVGDSAAWTALADQMRHEFVCTLARPLPDRWDGGSEWSGVFSAGFWAPAARDQPLPP